MNCEQANAHMMKYFDGELKETEKTQFMEHLEVCNACSMEFNCMSGIFSTLQTTGMADPPENFETNIMEKVNAIEKKRKERNARFLVALYNSAAIFSILLLVIFVADLDRMDLINAVNKAGGYFTSFTDITDAVFGVVIDIFKLLGGVIAVIFQAIFSVVKTYSYVFAGLLALLVALQQLFTYVVAHEGRKS